MNREIRLVGKRHVKLNEIVLLKANANYTSVLLEDGERIILSKTLKQMEERFTSYSTFFRTHKSYMVNLDHVSSVQTNGGVKIVKLKNNIDVDISRRRKDAFLTAMRSRQIVS